MRRSTLPFTIIVLSALVTACAGTPTMQEVPGSLYANYKLAKDAEGPVGSKQGQSCAKSILGWFGTGDASINTAAANGGISNVTTVEKHTKNFLGIYATYCTVVYGE